MRYLTGENYETEFPKDADMKPPGGLIPSWRPVLQFDINLNWKSMEIMNNWKGGHEND